MIEENNSISFTTDTLNVDESTDFSDQNSTSHSICNNLKNMLPENNLNEGALHELYLMEIDKLNTDLVKKPDHWDDEYWAEILKKYPWFLHKDNHAGCKICYNIKGLMGKKSQLATLKFFIMNLSYEQFEHKLVAHDASSQHIRCVYHFKACLSTGCGYEGINEILMKTIDSNDKSDLDCPQCYKAYKFKKSLSTHIYVCIPHPNSPDIDLLCNCRSNNITCLKAVDIHNLRLHASSILYVCKFCSSQFQRLTAMYEHLLVNHNFNWNPHLEKPTMVQREIVYNEIDFNEDAEEGKENRHIKNENYGMNRSQTMQMKKPHLKRLFREVPQSVTLESQIKESPNRGIPRYDIHLDSIVQCDICHLRYLDENILINHKAKYHNF